MPVAATTRYGRGDDDRVDDDDDGATKLNCSIKLATTGLYVLYMYLYVCMSVKPFFSVQYMAKYVVVLYDDAEPLTRKIIVRPEMLRLEW